MARLLILGTGAGSLGLITALAHAGSLSPSIESVKVIDSPEEILEEEGCGGCLRSPSMDRILVYSPPVFDCDPAALVAWAFIEKGLLSIRRVPGRIGRKEKPAMPPASTAPLWAVYGETKARCTQKAGVALGPR